MMVIIQIIIIAIILKVITDAKRSGSNSKKSTTNNRYGSNSYGHQNKYSGSAQTYQSIKDSEDWKKSQEARKAYLQGMYGQKVAEKSKVVPTAAEPIVNSKPEIELDIKPDTTLESNSNSILDSVFDTKFEIGASASLDDLLAPKFDPRFDTSYGFGQSDNTNNPDEETVADAFLKDYGLEKKIYEWE